MVQLFDGRVIPGRFRRNPANPYVAGQHVRQFIQSRVPTHSREQVLISVIGRHWRLFEPESISKEVARYGVRVANGKLTSRDLDSILKQIDTLNSRSGRSEAYKRLTRPAGLRQLVIGLMGARCQVECCDAAQSTAARWDDDAAALSVLEVHHIEEVTKVEDHSPRNLCVICANHHRLIHGFGPWDVHHEGDNVILTRSGRQLRIVRDLSVLA